MLGGKLNGDSPCWRPSRRQSVGSAGSPAGPGTNPAPPGSRWPVSGRPPLEGDREGDDQF